MGAFEDGSSFLAGVYAKLPEGLRAQAKTLFEAPEAKEAITVIGDGVLARPEFSRGMDDLRTKTAQVEADRQALATLQTQVRAKHVEQTNWYNANKPLLEEAIALKAAAARNGGGGDPDDDDPNRGTKTMTPEEMRQIAMDAIAAEGLGYINVSAWFASQAVKHSRMFDEDIDMQELANNPRVGKPHPVDPNRQFSLIDAYQEKYGEKVAERAKAAEEAKFNAEVERRMQEERTKQGPGHPFPLRTEPSVLDALTADRKPSDYTVDSATAEYQRLQQARAASGG